MTTHVVKQLGRTDHAWDTAQELEHGTDYTTIRLPTPKEVSLARSSNVNEKRVNNDLTES